MEFVNNIINKNLKNSNSDFIYYDNDYILHKLGFLINIYTYKILSPNNVKNYITFKGKNIYFPSLMLESFLQLKHIKKGNIIHLDNNLLNNSLDNLYYGDNSVIKKVYASYSIPKYYKKKAQYLFILYQYDKNFNLLKCHADLEYINKYIKLHNSNNNINSYNTKQFLSLLLNNQYILYNEFYWELKIKRIDTINNISENYIKINNLYYISKDHTHIINYNRKLLKICHDSYGNYYVNLYLDNLKKNKYILDFYRYPSKYIKNQIINNEEINKNTISKKNNENYDNNLYTLDKIMDDIYLLDDFNFDNFDFDCSNFDFNFDYNEYKNYKDFNLDNLYSTFENKEFH